MSDDRNLQPASPSFSTCAYCGGYCTPKGDPKSHGACDHCLENASPNMPSSKRHAEAMRRGHARMVAAGLHTTQYLAEIIRWDAQ